MEYMKPFAVQLDLIAGVMDNPATRIVRRASSMRGHYADAEALERLIAAGDPVHYEVAEQPVPDAAGQLRFGISTTHPGTVGAECFMTKGHYHAVADTAEIYMGVRGEGYMLMKTVEGECVWEKFVPGRVVYVPSFWAHRSVNTGEEPLVTFYVYPGNAGHNYGDIEKEGFPVRLMRRGGKVEFVKSRSASHG
jgi:glucose-6-phosphate isomerase